MATPPSARDETLAALLAAPPPRPVPPELRRAAGRQAASGRAFFFGALMLAMGVLVGTAGFPRPFWNDLRLDRSAARTNDASIVSVSRTHPYAGAAKRRVVYRYDFVFRPAGSSADVEGASYTNGIPRRRQDQVSVEFLAADPSVARLAGTRLNPQGYDAVPLMIFPLFGLLLAAFAWDARYRAVRLLAHGTLADATVAECTRFMSGGRSRRVAFRIKLAPKGDPGAAPWTLTTSRPEIVNFAVKRLADKQPVFVLFDPARPKSVLLPETLV